jgi:hypothetical protein
MSWQIRQFFDWPAELDCLRRSVSISKHQFVSAYLLNKLL